MQGEELNTRVKIEQYKWEFQVCTYIWIESVTLFIQFETAEFRFFKNRRMRELDESIGDIHNDIAGL